MLAELGQKFDQTSVESNDVCFDHGLQLLQEEMQCVLLYTNSLLKPHNKYIFTDLILKVPSLKNKSYKRLFKANNLINYSSLK